MYLLVVVLYQCHPAFASSLQSVRAAAFRCGYKTLVHLKSLGNLKGRNGRKSFNFSRLATRYRTKISVPIPSRGFILSQHIILPPRIIVCNDSRSSIVSTCLQLTEWNRRDSNTAPLFLFRIQKLCADRGAGVCAHSARLLEDERNCGNVYVGVGEGRRRGRRNTAAQPAIANLHAQLDCTDRPPEARRSTNAKTPSLSIVDGNPWGVQAVLIERVSLTQARLHLTKT